MKFDALQTAFIQQVIDGESSCTDFLAQLQTHGKLSPARQIEIYQGNYRGALQSCLKQIYPVCMLIVGEQYFTHLANNYITHHPSESADLNLYGQYFPHQLQKLLSQRNELSDFPYLVDLATLEKLYHNAYYIQNESPFDFDRFSALSDDGYQSLHFHLSKTLRLIKTPFPVLTIWQLNRKRKTMIEAIKMPEQAQYLIIFRRSYQVKVETLTHDDYHLLQRLEQDITLAELISQFESGAHFDINQQLTRLISKGWITGFEISHV